MEPRIGYWRLAALLIVMVCVVTFSSTSTFRSVDYETPKDVARRDARLEDTFLAITDLNAKFDQWIKSPGAGVPRAADRVLDSNNKPQLGKEDCEIGYWSDTYKSEVAQNETQEGHGMQNGHYRKIYTTGLELEESFYKDKKVLDVGCGPRGSLEWLKGIATSTVCVDPLANKYTAFGTVGHSMLYVTAGVEDMPFAGHSIDIISSINNFDHIVNAEKGLSEILRLLRPDGFFVIAVEIHPIPTRCEPIALGWDLGERINAAGFETVKARYHLNPDGMQHTQTAAIYGERLTREKVDELSRSSSKQCGWFIGVFKPK